MYTHIHTHTHTYTCTHMHTHTHTHLLVRSKEDAVGDVFGVESKCLLRHGDSSNMPLPTDTLIHLVDGTLVVQATGEGEEGGRKDGGREGGKGGGDKGIEGTRKNV